MSALALSSRAVVRVGGGLSQEFLQGLCTQDVYALKKDGSRRWAAFLNPKGRLLTDVMIQRESNESFLLDCHGSKIDSLMAWLRKHRLRKPIEIDDVSEDFRVVVKFPGAEKVALNQADCVDFQNETDGEVFDRKDDPRTSLMGKRFIWDAKSLSVGKKGSSSSEDASSLSAEEAYKRFRYTNGVPEGPLEMKPNEALPPKFNLDVLNFINYEKGCYTGQELTIRTHHTGAVRRRIGIVLLEDAVTGSKSPSDPLALEDVRFDNQIAASPSDGDIASLDPKIEHPVFCPKEERCGELVAVHGNIGLCTIACGRKIKMNTLEETRDVLRQKPDVFYKEKKLKLIIPPYFLAES